MGLEEDKKNEFLEFENESKDHKKQESWDGRRPSPQLGLDTLVILGRPGGMCGAGRGFGARKDLTYESDTPRPRRAGAADLIADAHSAGPIFFEKYVVC